MNSYKNYLYSFVLIVLICSCSSTNKPKIPENKILQEFCSLGVSYFDTLLKDVTYLFYRSGGYAINVKEGGFILLKSGTEFHYMGLSPVKDTTFYKLDVYRELFEQRHSMKKEKAKELIEFCYKWNIREIGINRDKHYYFFHLSCGTIYYRDSDPVSYDKMICDNWYFLEKADR